jgi:UDP-GlcNAc:undecaprenyl-phosphate GlcNAc-1-phosphate transferase
MVLSAVFLLLPPMRRHFTEQGSRWLYIVFLSFTLSFCLTPLARWFAIRINALDIPDSRKNHEGATPLLGGSAIFLAFLSAILINGVYSNELTAILISAAILFIIGTVDDVKEQSAKFKLAVQVVCVAWVVYNGVVLRVIPAEYGWLADATNWLLTLIWITGITNAFNFFDGMDGMASGLGVIISFFIGVVAFQSDQPFLGWVAAAMLGSCLGFIPYNLLKRGRATIFLGDAGSTVIGFILACIAVYGDWNPGNHVVAIAAPILIFWVLIFDMVHISVDRVISGKVHNFKEWIDYVGRDHFHHRISAALGGNKRSVFFIYFLSICFGCSAVALRNASTLDAVVLIIQAVFLVALVTVLERSGRMKNKPSATD